MPLTGNKGEWSEIYTLFKLLGDKKVFAGDLNLNRAEDLFYPIIKILRSEGNCDFEYEISENTSLVFISENGEKLIEIPIHEFQQQASSLLKSIKSASGSSFSLPETEAFMHHVACSYIKAKSTDKADIHIIIHDLRTKTTPLLGFSIKSMLGGASTLLNAGKTTNFIYKIYGDLPSDKVEQINNISSNHKIKDRLIKIHELNAELKFETLENQIFKNNLFLIDSLLPDILAEALKIFFSSNLNNINDITYRMEELNPLHFDMTNHHSFYEYKIKRFLVDVALGMMPAKVWNGEYDATGGYLIVKKDGDIVCYHIYNKNDFEDYLFHNTKFETASTTRHEFGTIETGDESLFFKLNLQIRFLH